MALRRKKTLLLFALAAALLAVIAAGCGGGDEDGTEDTTAAAETTAPAETAAPADTSEAAAETTEESAELSGAIEADGSSTVGPFTSYAAEVFQGEHPDVRITVGISGTGGGFERFCVGETDISDASRPIKDEEAAICAENGIDYVEFHVVNDGLAVVVNPENDWVECFTVEELNKIWAPESEGQVTNWNQVNPDWPDEPLVLAGPGTDSGTFDYFTEVINGEGGASRADYTASEDDNVIVQAIAGEPGGLGYFGLSYVEENQGTIKAVPVQNEAGECVSPSVETVQDGSYNPLGRPLFVYIKQESFARPEVQAFVSSMLEKNAELAEAALYVPLTDEQLATAQQSLDDALAQAG